MSNPETIDVESTTTNQAGPDRGGTTLALERRGEVGVGRALTIEQLHEKLEFIRAVMKKEMKEGQDYGKIPGTGQKPSLLQPGAQKLLLTFSLREQVKKEALREFPLINGIFGHREYEFTVSVFPAGGRIDDGWDGVGTCSTLESKYRYRKAERKCPQCGHTTIIAEKEEYVPAGQVPGFICWKKKGGCGAKFHAEHEGIIGQSTEDIENEDPADCWNTCRKMAFKRALVAAAINATNTSELWTQDLEDMAGNASAKGKGPKTAQAGSAATNRPPAAQKPQGAPAAAQAPAQAPGKSQAVQPKCASAETRAHLIRKLGDQQRSAVEYFRKLEKPNVLLPNEGLESIPLEFVPVNRQQFDALMIKLKAFTDGGPPEHAFQPNPLPEEEKKRRAAAKPKTPPPAKPEPKKRDPEWFWDVICPIPRKGMKRDEYLKHADTIGTLYRDAKAGNNDMQKRLWGFANHWQPEARTAGDRTYPVTEADKLFREGLDAFLEWHEKHNKENPFGY
jgi:ribosomal protein S27AE